MNNAFEFRSTMGKTQTQLMFDIYESVMNNCYHDYSGFFYATDKDQENIDFLVNSGILSCYVEGVYANTNFGVAIMDEITEDIVVV